MSIRFDGRVAIVTGAGAGLGRAHAVGLAERGARVVVNDYAAAPAEETAAMIRDAGGDAVGVGCDVADPNGVGAMVDDTMARWGRIDVLVNNAGILRDASFAKMTLTEWEAVIRVHLTGSAVCSMAVWPHMKAANYGRIVMTSSSSGLYGNFGQANYAAAKMGVVGLMNTLHIEGAKNDIRVNTLAPGAATQMTEKLLPPAVLGLMTPASVTPGLLYLASEEAPSRVILDATAGGFARTIIHETEGVWLDDAELTPEGVAAAFDRISDEGGQHVYDSGAPQIMKFVGKAAVGKGVRLG